MNTFLTALFTVSLAMSFVTGLLMLLNHLLTNKIPASFRYYMWLVVLAGLLIPFRPDISVPFAPIRLPSLSVTRREAPAVPSREIAAAGASLSRSQSVSGPLFSPVGLVFAVWLTGTLAFAFFHLRSYGKFISAVRRWGADAKESSAVMRAVLAGMGLEGRAIGARTCAFISSPMLIGFFKPVILLPETPIDPDELPDIFKHELTHYKRGDLWINLLVLSASAMHWFNPLVYLMAKAIRADCEAACDAAVVAGDSSDRRRRYGETIIGFTGAKRAVSPVLSTYFYGGGSIMKKRLVSIMDTSRKNNWLAWGCVMAVIMATVLSGSAVAATGAQNNYIGEARAKSVALSHAGVSEQQVDYIHVHLDREDGYIVYEVEFYSGNSEYDYEIGAVNGEILGYDKEVERRPRGRNRDGGQQSGQYIGEEKAKSIALSAAGISNESQTQRMRIRLDREDGRMVYDVEFRNDRARYEYDIDAVSGEVLKSESKR